MFTSYCYRCRKHTPHTISPRGLFEGKCMECGAYKEHTAIDKIICRRKENLMLIFDIETVAHPHANRWTVAKNPPSNWKDPAKIAAFKNKSIEEQLQKAALDPHTGLVRAIE